MSNKIRLAIAFVLGSCFVYRFLSAEQEILSQRFKPQDDEKASVQEREKSKDDHYKDDNIKSNIVLAEENTPEVDGISEEKIKKVFRTVVHYGLKATNMSSYRLWQDFQKLAIQRILSSQQKHALHKNCLKVLIAVSVSSKPTSVQNFVHWASYFESVKLQQQNRYGASDLFHFALNHYDNSHENWEIVLKKYKDILIMDRLGLRCKTFLWKQLNYNLTKGYDYIWLIDDDLSLEYFNWELTKLLLLKLNPLIMHPAVLPTSNDRRASDHPEMIAKLVLEFRTKKIALAINEGFAEVMAPMISTKFWPVIYERLETWELRSVWCLDCYWSRAAIRWGGEVCGLPAPLIVIHASPLVHKNFHSIDKSKDKPIQVTYNKTGCIKHKVGRNRFLSTFHAEILKPTDKTNNENKRVYNAIKNMVQPQFPCMVNSSHFSKKTKWTFDQLTQISEGRFSSIN